MRASDARSSFKDKREWRPWYGGARPMQTVAWSHSLGPRSSPLMRTGLRYRHPQALHTPPRQRLPPPGNTSRGKALETNTLRKVVEVRMMRRTTPGDDFKTPLDRLRAGRPHSTSGSVESLTSWPPRGSAKPSWSAPSENERHSPDNSTTKVEGAAVKKKSSRRCRRRPETLLTCRTSLQTSNWQRRRMTQGGKWCRHWKMQDTCSGGCCSMASTKLLKRT
mmetsp:Transcript_19605/g.57193  ORF Transcript_19605/g.57193 Transcript_19605/m.57193 type:complete len:221 (-) Transcript_19605:422-1084(-)